MYDLEVPIEYYNDSPFEGLKEGIVFSEVLDINVVKSEDLVLVSSKGRDFSLNCTLKEPSIEDTLGEVEEVKASLLVSNLSILPTDIDLSPIDLVKMHPDIKIFIRNYPLPLFDEFKSYISGLDLDTETSRLSLLWFYSKFSSYDPHTKSILVPLPVNAETLYILIHELSHIGVPNLFDEEVVADKADLNIRALNVLSMDVDMQKRIEMWKMFTLSTYGKDSTDTYIKIKELVTQFFGPKKDYLEKLYLETGIKF